MECYAEYQCFISTIAMHNEIIAAIECFDVTQEEKEKVSENVCAVKLRGARDVRRSPKHCTVYADRFDEEDAKAS